LSFFPATAGNIGPEGWEKNKEKKKKKRRTPSRDFFHSFASVASTSDCSREAEEKGAVSRMVMIETAGKGEGRKK